jgi:hypothetical protein
MKVLGYALLAPSLGLFALTGCAPLDPSILFGQGGSTGNPQDEFKCRDGGIIASSLVCNGKKECKDGSDESALLCGEPETFQCRDGSIIPLELRCNDKKECKDGSDEVDCAINTPEFVCADRARLPLEVLCNGKPDCKDGSDEWCDGSSYFKCFDGSGAVSTKLVCDQQVKDCADGSDEAEGYCQVLK